MIVRDLRAVLAAIAERGTFFDRDGNELSEIDLDSADWAGDQPLHILTLQRDNQGVEVLLLAGADVNVRGEAGMTALHYAAATQNIPLIKMLIANGADSSILSDAGQTAEELARIAGGTETVQLLSLRAGG